MMAKLEDMELNAIADARKGQKVVKVKLDEL
jgi:antitoxin StbD